MHYAVAATTWTNLLGCKQYKGASTLDAIRAFGKATWSKFGGERRGLPVHRPDPREPRFLARAVGGEEAARLDGRR